LINGTKQLQGRITFAWILGLTGITFAWIRGLTGITFAWIRGLTGITFAQRKIITIVRKMYMSLLIFYICADYLFSYTCLLQIYLFFIYICMLFLYFLFSF
jgi:hypothetical protein